MSIMLEVHPSLGRALVVGGGRVAARKVRTLIEGSFAVSVIAANAREEIHEAVEVIERDFEAGDTAGFALVFACTDNREVNRMVGEEARAAGVPVLVADSQPESTMFSPAVYRDGDLLAGVSTGGASPRLAQALRDRIAEALATVDGSDVDAAREARETERAGERR